MVEAADAPVSCTPPQAASAATRMTILLMLLFLGGKGRRI
jgi:hypothetical protein